MLPAVLSISIAARLAGRSRPTFRRRVLPLCMSADGRVDRAALERHLGSPITVEAYFAADQYLAAGQRRRQREYRVRSHGPWPQRI